MALIGHGKSDTKAGAGYEQNQEIKTHLMTATRSKGHEYDAVSGGKLESRFLLEARVI